MRVRIEPSVLSGIAVAPPSKSMAHRLLICAGLASGTSVIENVAFSEDILATLDCLKALGASVTVCGSTVTVTGCGIPKASELLPCRESGSTLRFMIPLCLVSGGGDLTGSERLMERPLSVYEDLFGTRNLSLTRASGTVSVRGTLKSGIFALPGDVSSQFFTGLLFALPLLEGESRVEATTPLESASYLLLTLSALKQFGITVIRESERVFVIPGGQTYRPCRTAVEGDESNAAFWGAMELPVAGRNPETLQGDRVWEDLFSRLREGYCRISLRDCPDLAPVLMTVASLYHGGLLTETRRLKIKESDRGAVMAEELAKFGADIRVAENEIEIRKAPLFSPKIPLQGHNDHRVVMSLAVLASRYGGEIGDAQAVRKSYPEFWQECTRLGLRWEEV